MALKRNCGFANMKRFELTSTDRNIATVAGAAQQVLIDPGKTAYGHARMLIGCNHTPNMPSMGQLYRAFARAELRGFIESGPGKRKGQKVWYPSSKWMRSEDMGK